MPLFQLSEEVRQLPHAWSSRLLARFGDAQLKVLRMDEADYPEECHDYAEGLLVLDGQMLLRLDGQTISIGAGDLYVVPAGVPHSVAPGSRGTLLILDT
ncbi:cupin domain-containing protein [Dyella sp. 20L07]|uniref:cupin domain-containing protein n=1 Tax=Dyella sp. 20L07 TaxID=3384240 RepID=UPI003D2DAA3D